MVVLTKSTPTRKINYLYNALGQKVEKKITNNLTETVTNYQGMFHYENQVLKFIGTSEGYVNVTSGRRTENGPSYVFNYVYNYTDHLGNIRVSYTNNGINAAIIEENHYYPFGLKHKKYGMADPVPKLTYQYKYNGMEYQDELNLNFYDYGARNYDPAIGRWMNVDPLAEQAPDWTPYRYGFNNPIRYTDPTGMFENDDWYLNLKNGNYEWFDGSAEKSGYWNLGAETDIAVGKGYALRDNGVFTDNNTGKTYGREKSLKVEEGGGFTIKSNGTFGEKASNFLSNIAAPFLEVPQDIIFPIINQTNIIINEGVHEGGAYDSSNYVFPNTYKLDNWSFTTGQSTTSSGTPTWEEGKGKINNVISVTPLGIKTGLGKSTLQNYVIDKAATSIIKTTAKKTVENVK